MKRISMTVLALTLMFLLSPTAPAQTTDDAPDEAGADGAVAEAKAAPAKVSDEDAKKAAELYEGGRRLYFQGKYENAIKQLADAATTDPTKSSYKLLLAKAQRQAGHPDDAINALSDILEANPEHVEAAIALSELVTPEKQPQRVIAVLEPLLKYKTDYPLYHLLAQAYYQRASTLEEPDDIKDATDKARQYYEEATRLNPRSADDHYQLGNIYLSQKQFARAATAYERAGELGIDTPAYHFKLATVYYNLRNYLGRITTAEVIGGKVGQITPNRQLLIDPVPGRKDQFYVAERRSAIYQVFKAEALGIEMNELQFLKANIWQSARRYEKADDIYKGMQKKIKEEDTGLFWFYWARTALGLGDLETYLDRLDKAIKAQPEVYEPTLADAYVTVATRYHQRGEYDKYISFLTKAVETNPLSARLHLTLGDAYWQANDKDKAIEQYELVLELQPDHGRRVQLLNRIRGQENDA